jgi:alpha-galactosidase
VKKLPTSRRRFLKLAAAGASVAGATFDLALGADSSPATLADGRISIEVDSQMRMRVSALTDWSVPDNLGAGPTRWILKSASKQDLHGPLGKGTRLRLIGEADTPHLQKTVVIELYRDYPGFALYQVSYRNLGTEPLATQRWSQLDLTVPHENEAFWSFCGSTHSDRRDWVQPVRAGFNQDNFMGMEASDYGGGTPIVDVWRPGGGLAIGHIETTPRLVSLPLTCGERELKLSMTATARHTLKSGDELVHSHGRLFRRSGYLPADHGGAWNCLSEASKGSL